MNVEETREKMQYIWHFSEIFSRESSHGDVWRRYNPSIAYPIETVKNNYLLHYQHSHSYEKMMYDNCIVLLNKIKSAKKIRVDYEDRLEMIGFNYHFFLMDWAYQKSSILGLASMPSVIGTISNVLKLFKNYEYKKDLRKKTIELYDRIVYPSLRASGASLYFRIEEDSINHIIINENKISNIKGIDIVIESLTELSQNLKEYCKL